MAVTYAQVYANPEAHRALCAGVPTLLIGDEIHHAGDGLGWGAALRRAYGAAAERLLLSGTPFRSDAMTIPWVRYRAGRSEPDYRYTYAAALADGAVCRPVLFPSIGGAMEWSARGARRRADFGAAVEEGWSAQRLRTALSPEGEWLPAVLARADGTPPERR